MNRPDDPGAVIDGGCILSVGVILGILIVLGIVLYMAPNPMEGFAPCNPDHLEPVTHAENVRRSALALRASL